MIRQGGPCIPEPVPSPEDIEERNRREHLSESQGICGAEKARLCGCVRNNESGTTRCELQLLECNNFLAQQDPPFSVDECITEKMNEAGYQYEPPSINLN